MERVLEIQSDGKTIEIPIRISLRAGRIYRTAFGRDLVEDLVSCEKEINGDKRYKLLAALSELDVNPRNKKAVDEALIKHPDLVLMAMEEPMLTFSETERAQGIIWAFAKNANEHIQGPEDWVDSFPISLPVQKLIPTLLTLWQDASQTTVSIKNG